MAKTKSTLAQLFGHKVSAETAVLGLIELQVQEPEIGGKVQHVIDAFNSARQKLEELIAEAE